MAIETTRDAEGLRQAVLELLERGFAQGRVARTLDDCDDDGRERISDSLPPLTLSPGYYKLAEYFLWLDRAKKCELIEGAFTVTEADGLLAVSDARGEFERNHPACGICGALQESPFATSCHKCGTDFVQRSA